MKKALVIVDVQNDFVTGSLGTKEAKEMLPHLVRKLEKVVEEKSADLYFTVDTHKENYLETQEGKFLPVEHCIKNTDGWKIVPELGKFVEKAKDVVEKKTFGATRLPALLKPYDEIEFVGLCTDICVVSNALLLKAFYPETLISVDAKCCAGVTPESHLAALTTLKSCQCKIYND